MDKYVVVRRVEGGGGLRQVERGVGRQNHGIWGRTCAGLCGKIRMQMYHGNRELKYTLDISVKGGNKK